MALLICIETATDVCSVALARDGELIALHESAEKYKHAAMITVLITRCLEQAGYSARALDAIAVSHGPGSFTGLRVGVSAAKGLCFAWDRPLLAVGTLAALANGSIKAINDPNAWYCPMIDARRNEVYLALYDAGLGEQRSPEAVILDEEGLARIATDRTLILSGDGAFKMRSKAGWNKLIFSDVVCSAKHMIAPATDLWQRKQYCDLTYFAPMYLKSPNITTPKNVV